MAATQCMLPRRYSQDDLLKFKPSMGKKGDINDAESMSVP